MISVGAIDIGSNAIRLVIASVDESKKLHILDNQREPLRLGQDVFSRGEISKEATERAVSTFMQFRATLDKWNVKHFRAVGTSALREARNRDEFLSIIKEKTGISIDVISGAEEARLIHIAVRDKVKLRGKVALLVDIGGGSVELSLVEDGNVIHTDSVGMGTVRLLQILEEKKYGQEKFSQLVKDYTNGLRRVVKREVGKRRVSLCIGTGGNIESLGFLRMSVLKKEKKTLLKRGELENLTKRIEKLPFEKRVSILKLRPDRADVVLPAALVLLKIMKAVAVNEIIAPHVGLKDGLLIEMSGKARGDSRTTPRTQILSYARELGRRFSYDASRAERVARRASTIFDVTRALHGLDDEDKTLLEAAALVLDIGSFIDPNGFHKHSHYILKSVPFVGLDIRQRDIVAAVTRFQRKGFPSMENDVIQSLQAPDRKRTRCLVLLVRLSNALESDSVHPPRRVSIEHRNGSLSISFPRSKNYLIEKWGLMKELANVREVLGVPLVISP